MKVGEVTAKFKADYAELRASIEGVRSELTKFKSQVENTTSNVQNIGKGTGPTNQLNSSFGALFGSATKLAGIFGIGLSIGGTIQYLGNAKKAADELQLSLTGLTTTAARFGEDVNKAQTYAKMLADDGLITVTTAASGLQKLLLGGVGLDTAYRLMQGYKDQASFGRTATIGMDQAVENLSESFYTENSMIGNLSGQTENWQMILEKGAAAIGKDVNSLSEKEKVLAKVAGQMKLNQVVEGDAARYASTDAGIRSRQQAEFTKLAQIIGQIVNPAMTMFSQVMSGVASSAIEFLQQNLKSLQSAAVITAAVLIGLVQVIGGLAGSIVNLMSGNLKGAISSVNSTISNLSSNYQNTQQKLTAISKGEYGKMSTAGIKAMDAIGDASSKKQKKLAQDLEKETEKFNDENEKRKKSFEENMQSLVQAHLKKVKDIKKDQDDENKSYKDTVDEATANFKEKMKEMADSHKEKVNEIQKQLKEEQDSYDEKTKDVTEKFEEEKAKYKDQAKRITDIQAAIAKEKDKGSGADQNRITFLEKILGEEQDDYDAHIGELSKNRDKDLNDLKKNYDKQVLSLQEKLAKENLEYDKQTQKEEKTFADSAAKDKKRHDERIAELDKQLADEKAILEKHQSEVDAYKDKAVEDDIDRAKRKYAEENAEALKNHLERMQELQNQGGAEGAAFGNALAGGVGGGLSNFKDLVDASSKQAGDALAKNISDGTQRSVISMDIFKNGFQLAILSILGVITGQGPLIGMQFASLKNLIEGAGNSMERMKNSWPGWMQDIYNTAKEWATKIKEQMSKLDPFKRQSPSLVDKVLMGTETIAGAYRGLASEIKGINLDQSMLKDKFVTSGATQQTSYDQRSYIEQHNTINKPVDIDAANSELAWRIRNA